MEAQSRSKNKESAPRPRARPCRFRLTQGFLAALACLALGPSPLAAQDRPIIWVALIKASNGEAPPDPKLTKVAPRLKKVFGFSSYRLIQEAQVPLGEPYEQWVLPSRQIYLKVVPLHEKGLPQGSVHFEVYREDVPLVQGKFTPTAGRPLFINGPDCPSGRLVVALQLADPGPSPFGETENPEQPQKTEKTP
jgi:hypothetical protein